MVTLVGATRRRRGRVVHPRHPVVDLVQGVERHHDDHRRGADRPGGVAGAGRSPPLGHEDPEAGAAVRDVASRELGDVLVVGAAALGFDHREQPIAGIVDGDVGVPTIEVELVHDLVGRPGHRIAGRIEGDLRGERAEHLVEGGRHRLGQRRLADGLEQGERTDGGGEVLGPGALRPEAVTRRRR